MPRFSPRRLALSALSLALAGCTAAPQAQLVVTAAPDDATSPFSRAGSPSPAPSVVDVEVAARAGAARRECQGGVRQEARNANARRHGRAA